VTRRLLIRNGCVLALDPKVANLRVGDVLIEDALIAEIGQGLRARDAETIDATDCIVMPGFVDAHRHVRDSLFRNMGDITTDGEIADVDDVYAATLIGLLGAVEAGITTVVDWVDLPDDSAAHEAVLQAHSDVGLRTVFVQASATGHSSSPSSTPMTTFGRGVPEPVLNRLERVAGDWEAAQRKGLPIHAHAGSHASDQGAIAELRRRDLLGPDVNLIHCSRVGDSDLEAIASSGAMVTLAPSAEMAAGQGTPQIQKLMDRGIRPALAVGSERLAPGDMFAQMRAVISLQHATYFDLKLAGKAGLPQLMTTREVIRYATANGARAAGIGTATGTLDLGKQADVIVLRADRPNIHPMNDPIGAVVWGMDTSNVDWVVVGGRILMRNGVLEADVVEARRLAVAARERVAVNAGEPL